MTLHAVALAHHIGWPPIAALLTAGLAALLFAVGMLTAAQTGPGRHARTDGTPPDPHGRPNHHHAARRAAC